MGNWGEGSGLDLGGVFDGSTTPEGSGSRVKVGINMPFGLPSIPLVDKHIGGLAKGGVIGQNRAQAHEASASRRRTTRQGPTASEAAEASARRRGPGPRQGGADAPSGRRSSSGASAPTGHTHHRGSGGRLVNPVAVAAGGVGGPRRRKHEIAPGVPCPSCAAGITKPVK